MICQVKGIAFVTILHFDEEVHKIFERTEKKALRVRRSPAPRWTLAEGDGPGELE